jgi:hypothetical protein
MSQVLLDPQRKDAMTQSSRLAAQIEVKDREEKRGRNAREDKGWTLRRN